MKRMILTTLLLLIAAGPALGGSPAGRTGIGGQFGIHKLVGGDRDYSNVDQNIGLWLRHGFSPQWSGEIGAHYGWVRPGALRDEDAGFTFGSVHAFYTTMLTWYGGVRYHLSPENSFSPYLGGRVGLMNWQVRDENGNDFGHFPGGPTVRGYDKSGNPVDLEGNDVLLGLTLGTEYFLSHKFALELGARYEFILGNDRDNVGTSALWGPGHADVNSGRWDLFVGGTFYWGGSRDKDGDGIEDKLDSCPEAAEDFDGFRDEDGCPESDNDGDGIWDDDDRCPDDGEDMDGYRDEDGCPDPDNDSDGIVDGRDGCPDAPEDFDGFEDEDGCPDPDNDGDGVLDVDDRCPETAPGVEVGPDGCPKAAVIKKEMVLEGVTFASGSDDLSYTSYAALDRVAASLKAYPEVTIEIQGHTDYTGSAAHNLDVSSRRAAAVKTYLVSRGIDPARMEAVGYGEELPIADNDTPEGRSRNRRVELVRTN